jgi:tRNA-dependent cyclodipeptide synthase
MGISLDNPVFRNESLKRLLLWAAGHFDECLVVVGDHLRRFNEQMLNGLEGADAIDAARRVGDEFVRRSTVVFEKLPENKVALCRWQECLASEEYKRNREAVDRLFEREEEFRAAVERDAYSFVKRQRRRGGDFAVSTDKAIELSSQYLLEEISVFGALAEQGWRVELYPGPELEVLSNIARGRYDGVPRGLKERINVELGSGCKGDDNDDDNDNHGDDDNDNGGIGGDKG